MFVRWSLMTRDEERGGAWLSDQICCINAYFTVPSSAKNLSEGFIATKKGKMPSQRNIRRPIVPSLGMLIAILMALTEMGAFTAPSQVSSHSALFGKLQKRRSFEIRMASEDSSSGDEDGVVELIDDDDNVAVAEAKKESVTPFLSQGEILEESLNPDLSDPKQTRVIIYIILSLIPVLFLIPLMLGSRDLIPLDALPPVEMGM